MNRKPPSNIPPTQALTIPVELNPYLEIIISSFLQEVERQDQRDWQPSWEGVNYYHKWISTKEISKRLGVKADKARRDLNKLEKLGYIESKREPNWILWAAKKITGYKQHMFTDYFCKAS